MNNISLSSLILFTGLFLTTGKLSANELPRWSPEARKAWWTTNNRPEDWSKIKQRTQEVLIQHQKAKGTAWAMNDPAFVQWMGHLYWLNLFPPAWEKNHESYVAAFRHLALEPNLPWMLLANLRPEDNPTNALKILCDLYLANPKVCREYAGLAVATALVWDQPLESAWPHPFVDRKVIAFGKETPLQRFQFFVASHAQRRLLHDPRRLSVHELVFLIDSPLTLKELQLGQRIKAQSPQQLAKLYKAVDYNYRRVSKNETLWDSEPYTLATIAKHGGICMDQAYLVCQTGKAKGVPTILFFGQGTSGMHAWVGILEAHGKWQLNVARYKSQGYPVGQAYHPQTRLRISDVELNEFTQQLGGHPNFRKARLMLGWARMNPSSSLYPELILGARKLMPQMLASWTMEDEWHQAKGKDPARHARFLQRWITYFAQVPATRFEGQKRLYRLYRKHHLMKEAEALQKQIVKETKSQRFDLGIHLAADTIFSDMRNRQWDRAEKGFREAMGQFRKQTGGHLFYGLFQPYVQTCIEERQIKLARNAMKYASQFGIKHGTVMSNDLKDLKQSVEAY